MSTSALITMLLTWTIVTALTVYYFVQVLRLPSDKK